MPSNRSREPTMLAPEADEMYETPGPRSRSRSATRQSARDGSPSRPGQQMSRRSTEVPHEPGSLAAAPTPTRRSSRNVLGASPSSLMSSARTPLYDNDDDEDDEDERESDDERRRVGRRGSRSTAGKEEDGDDEFRPGRNTARRSSISFAKRSVSRGNDQVGSSSSRGAGSSRKPSRRDSKGSSSAPAPPASSSSVPIPRHPELRPGDTVIDPSNPNRHGCPYCDKWYEGQHARSICRRHQMSKHGIELEVQVKKSRWDNNPNRPATEEEKHQRTLESKRRWAAKDRRRRRCEKLGIPFVDSEDEDGEPTPGPEPSSSAALPLPPATASKARSDSGKAMGRQRSMSGSVAGGSEASSTKPARSSSARRPHPARVSPEPEAETPQQPRPMPQPRYGQQIQVYQPEYAMARSYSLDGQPMMGHAPHPLQPPPPMPYYAPMPSGSMFDIPPPHLPPQTMPAYYPPATMVATPARTLPSSHARTPSNPSQPLQLALHLPSQKKVAQVVSPPKRTLRAPAKDRDEKSPLLPSAKVDKKTSRNPDSDSDEEAAEILLAISASPARPVKETQSNGPSHRRTNSTLAQSIHVDDLFTAPPIDETPIKQLDSRDKRPDAQAWPYRRRGASMSSLADEDPFQPPSLRPHDDLSSSVSRRGEPETPMTPDVVSQRRSQYALQPALDLRRAPSASTYKQADPFRVPEAPFPESSSQSLLSSPAIEAREAAPLPATTSALRSGVTPFRTRGAGMATPARNGAIPPSPALFSFSSPSGLDITHKLGLAPAVQVPESPTWLEMVRATPDARNRRNRTGSSESEPALHPFDESPRKRLRL